MKKLLIISDDPKIVELFKSIYLPERYLYYTVTYADKVAELVSNTRPDLVVLYYNGNDEKTAQILRSLKHKPPQTLLLFPQIWYDIMMLADSHIFLPPVPSKIEQAVNQLLGVSISDGPRIAIDSDSL